MSVPATGERPEFADAGRLAVMLKLSGLGMRHTEVNLQVIDTSQARAEAAG